MMDIVDILDIVPPVCVSRWILFGYWMDIGWIFTHFKKKKKKFHFM